MSESCVESIDETRRNTKDANQELKHLVVLVIHSYYTMFFEEIAVLNVFLIVLHLFYVVVVERVYTFKQC